MKSLVTLQLVVKPPFKNHFALDSALVTAYRGHTNFIILRNVAHQVLI